MKLNDLFVAATSGGPLLARFTAAVWRAATKFRTSSDAATSEDKRVEWAKRALLQDGKAQSYASIMLRMALAENDALRAAWSPQDHDELISDELIESIVVEHASFMAQSDL